MSANTPNHPPRPGLPMPAKRVAEICQLTVSDIYRAHTEDMGAPGHFIYRAGDTHQSYTLEGLCELVTGLRALGHDLEAKILAVEVERQRQLLGMVSAPTSACGKSLLAKMKIEPPAGHRWDLESEQRQDEIYGGRDAA